MLQASNLSKKYNGRTALDHVNVEMGDGKIYAFLGPNGSGKTTFMKRTSFRWESPFHKKQGGCSLSSY